MRDPEETRQRAAVIAEARTWLGTPFVNCGGTKGANVDCAMLLCRVFAATGVLAPFDPRPYPPDWHLHQEEERFLGWITGPQVGAVETQDLEPANVVVFKVGRCHAHGAILIGGGLMIHAWKKDRVVSISGLGYVEFAKRPRKVFDIWAGRRARNA